MKAKDVKVGAVYSAKISGKLTHVRLTGECRSGGWDAVNVATGRAVRIKTEAKLRNEVTPKAILPATAPPFRQNDGVDPSP